MYIPEELTTFTSQAEELATKMSMLADSINAGEKDWVEGCKEMDGMAREQIMNMETLKDLCYRLSKGEARVS